MRLGGKTMSKLRLGVVFGGQSSEYSVSLHSVASFLRQIHADNYDMTLIGINKNGHFYLYNGDVDSIEHDTWENKETCVSCAWVNGGIMPLDGSNKVIELDCVFPVFRQIISSPRGTECYYIPLRRITFLLRLNQLTTKPRCDRISV